MSGKCIKCKLTCVFKEDKHNLFGFPCDICSRMFGQNCIGSQAGSDSKPIENISLSVSRYLCPEEVTKGNETNGN